ncbi:MAG: ABC transporter permease, partial [Oscillospiraceae bacterium]|nr:ABC transporter permease [Oscillospiraceae bacterium]
MKRAKFPLALALAGLLLVAYAAYTAWQIPGLLQYAVPADVPPTRLEKDERPPLYARMQALAEEKEALAAVTDAVTLTGVRADMSVSAEAQGEAAASSAPAGLLAVDAAYQAIHNPLPLVGRLFQPEELSLGENVALLDEQLAISLFHMVEAVDRRVTVQGVAYRVIGVLRHARRVGDLADAFVYIPLEAAARENLALDTLQMTARPLSGGGATPTFTQSAQLVKPGGTIYSLRKEKEAAIFWARMLVCGLGAALLVALFGWWRRAVSALTAALRERLLHSYLPGLLPWLCLRGLPLLLWLLAIIAGACLAVTAALAPALIFPEYVPSILVEPREIAATFWNLRRAEAAAVVVRTAEVVRLRYFGGLVNIGCITVLAGVGARPPPPPPPPKAQKKIKNAPGPTGVCVGTKRK